MKTIITGLAIFMILFTAYIFQSDFQKVERVEQYMKHGIDEAAAGGVLMWEAEEYGEGNLVFNDTQALKYINHITNNRYEYVINVFDDSMVYRQYGSDGETTAQAISLPYHFTDGTGFSTLIDKPSIIIEAKARYRYSLDIDEKIKIIKRSVKYVVEGR